MPTMKAGLPVAVLCTAALAAACGDKVPAVEDPSNPVVNGVAMKRQEFLEKYCMSQERAGQTPCILVLREERKSSTVGEMPKW